MRGGTSCLFLLALLIGVPARAADCPVEFEKTEQVFEDFSFDTGWLPPGESIQVRFIVELGDTFSASLPGAAVLEDESRVRFDGTPDGGSFSMNLGPEVRSMLKLDLDVPGVGAVEWEGELPSAPNFDWRFDDQTIFTPFLLTGSSDRPASLSDEVPQQRLIEQSLGGLIPVPGISGGVAVDVAGVVQSSLSGEEISLGQGSISEEGQSVAVDGAGGFSGQANYRATLQASGTLYFYPTVFVEFVFDEYELAEFEIPVELPTVEDQWQFGPQQVDISEESTDSGGCSCGKDHAGSQSVVPLLLALLSLLVLPRARVRDTSQTREW